MAVVLSDFRLLRGDPTRGRLRGELSSLRGDTGGSRSPGDVTQPGRTSPARLGSTAKGAGGGRGMASHPLDGWEPWSPCPMYNTAEPKRDGG